MGEELWALTLHFSLSKGITGVKYTVFYSGSAGLTVGLDGLKDLVQL